MEVMIRCDPDECAGKGFSGSANSAANLSGRISDVRE